MYQELVPQTLGNPASNQPESPMRRNLQQKPQERSSPLPWYRDVWWGERGSLGWASDIQGHKPWGGARRNVTCTLETTDPSSPLQTHRDFFLALLFSFLLLVHFLFNTFFPFCFWWGFKFNCHFLGSYIKEKAPQAIHGHHISTTESAQVNLKQSEWSWCHQRAQRRGCI